MTSKVTDTKLIGDVTIHGLRITDAAPYNGQYTYVYGPEADYLVDASGQIIDFQAEANSNPESELVQLISEALDSYDENAYPN